MIMHYTIALSLLLVMFVHVIKTENVTVSEDFKKASLNDDFLMITNNHSKELYTLINPCPASCSCVLKETILEVNCSARNLTSIPIPGNNFQLSALHPISLMLPENEISELTSKMFQNFSRTERIVACLNGMVSVDVEAFFGLLSLREVDLSDNIIEFIHPDTFKENVKLETINLSGNVLLQVSVTTPFLNAPHLKNLMLSYCKLSSLSEVTFSNLKNLITLDLSSNDLTSLSLKTLSQMEDLDNVDLSNNRWTCNCKMQTVFEWISQRKGDIQSLKPVRCCETNGRTRKLWSIANSTTYCKRENNYNNIFKIAPESAIIFKDAYATEVNHVNKNEDEDMEVVMEIKSDISIETSGNNENAMVYGGLIFFIQHNLDSVYAILIVVLLFSIVILFAILLTKRVIRNQTLNLDQLNTSKKHNLTLSFGDAVRGNRSSFAPLLAPNSPTNEGLTTPVEDSDREQPPSLYYEYINSTPEHIYEIIR